MTCFISPDNGLPLAVLLLRQIGHEVEEVLYGRLCLFQ